MKRAVMPRVGKEAAKVEERARRMRDMNPILVTSGEPAGIGPDICLSLTQFACPVVIMGDRNVLNERARLLNRRVEWIDYYPGSPRPLQSHQHYLWHVDCLECVLPGQLNPENAAYVMHMLTQGVHAVREGLFSALVTAPVHKANMNDAGIAFSGHTEFLAQQCGVDQVVMMLAQDQFRVALVTTHLPLREVPDAIHEKLLTRTLTIINQSLQQDFGIQTPRIWVAGLNPHAGEGGYLGTEDIEVVVPVLERLRLTGMDVTGPLPADTMFLPDNLIHADVFVAMYHDQGLPVLKYAGFDRAVNVTLGLPIVRTSVDHGTALSLAGKGLASPTSLVEAVKMAESMTVKRCYSPF